MTADRYSFWKNYIESSLSEFLPKVEEKSRTLYDAMDYSLSAGGKRLRPLLLLEACSVCGGDASQALPYACAIEFIHTYSLILIMRVGEYQYRLFTAADLTGDDRISYID